MKKNIISILVSTLVATLVLGSCSTTKKAGETTVTDAAISLPLKQRLVNTLDSYKDWSTFRTSGKIVIGGKQQFSSTMQLSMVKGKSISVSIRPLLGIEMGKIFITSDSIIVLNKFEKYYIAENLKMISNGIPMNINDMQNIFLARMFELGKGALKADAPTLKSIEKGEGSMMNVTLVPENLGFSYTFAVKGNNEVKALKVSLDGVSKDYYVNYYDHSSTDYGKIANTFELSSMMDGQKISLKLEYDPMYEEWDKPFTERMPIDSRYHRVDGKTLLQGWFK